MMNIKMLGKNLKIFKKKLRMKESRIKNWQKLPKKLNLNNQKEKELLINLSIQNVIKE